VQRVVCSGSGGGQATLACYLTVHAGPRALPSFPTRRSSDLSGLLEDGKNPRGVVALVQAQVGLPGERRAEEAPRALEILAGRVPDRKSTRLNSSHRTISYAVFCLKKKNRDPAAPRTSPAEHT